MALVSATMYDLLEQCAEVVLDSRFALVTNMSEDAFQDACCNGVKAPLPSYTLKI